MVFGLIKPIVKSYFNIFLYKIFPIIIPLSLLGYDNEYINILRFVIVYYMYINLFINDSILRESIKLRTIREEEHNCSKCSQNVIWNIQDQAANIIFLTIGSTTFRYNIYLDIYWRSFVHTLPLSMKNRLCIQRSIGIQWIGIVAGIINYASEYLLRKAFHYDYVLFLMTFIYFVIDCFLFNLNTKNIQYYIPTNFLLKVVWKLSQCLTLGIIEIKKRNIGNKNVVLEIVRILSYIKNNTFYRYVFWQEFRSIDNFISYGSTSIFYREHTVNLLELLLNVKYFLHNNTTFKFARKTKLLHMTSIFKPYLSAENKFYITLFEARKEIEPFIKELIEDLETSIQTTKCVLDFEELYEYDIQLDRSIHLMESYYKNK